MLLAEVWRVLDELEAAGVRSWVGGGWGVDALAGTTSREHRDIDLLVDAACLEEALRALEGLGYERETDWLPVRVEYGAAGRGWVDVHPMVLDAGGNGRQEGLGGSSFDYPVDDLVTGTLHGRGVPCLSASLQRSLHAGYEPRPQDEHDLRVLDRVERGRGDRI